MLELNKFTQDAINCTWSFASDLALGVNRLLDTFKWNANPRHDKCRSQLFFVVDVAFMNKKASTLTLTFFRSTRGSSLMAFESDKRALALLSTESRFIAREYAAYSKVYSFVHSERERESSITNRTILPQCRLIYILNQIR